MLIYLSKLINNVSVSFRSFKAHQNNDETLTVMEDSVWLTSSER
jgi:hypothetical protein